MAYPEQRFSTRCGGAVPVPPGGPTTSGRSRPARWPSFGSGGPACRRVQPLEGLRNVRWAHCEDGRDVVLTMVAGRVVAERGHVAGVAESALLDEARGLLHCEAAGNGGRPRESRAPGVPAASSAGQPQRMSAFQPLGGVMINPTPATLTRLCPPGQTGYVAERRAAPRASCVRRQDLRFRRRPHRGRASRRAAPDLVIAACGPTAIRVGAFRIFELLRGLGIPPAVLLNTSMFDEAPAVMAAARRAGPRSSGTASPTPTRCPG